MVVPGEEVEFGVERCEGFTDTGHGFLYHFVVGAGFATFMSRFEEDEAFEANGFLTARADFPGSLREFFGDGAEL